VVPEILFYSFFVLRVVTSRPLPEARRKHYKLAPACSASRNDRRSSLPVGVLGKASINTTCSGVLYAAMRARKRD
jgi:hypothetical protein